MTWGVGLCSSDYAFKEYVTFLIHLILCVSTLVAKSKFHTPITLGTFAEICKSKHIFVFCKDNVNHKHLERYLSLIS